MKTKQLLVVFSILVVIGCTALLHPSQDLATKTSLPRTSEIGGVTFFYLDTEAEIKGNASYGTGVRGNPYVIDYRSLIMDINGYKTVGIEIVDISCYVLFQDITIRDFYNAITVSDCCNIGFSNIVITNCSIGITVQYSFNVVFDQIDLNRTFNGQCSPNSGDPVTFSNDQGTSLTNSKIGGNGHRVYIHDSENVLIENNQLVDAKISIYSENSWFQGCGNINITNNQIQTIENSSDQIYLKSKDYTAPGPKPVGTPYEGHYINSLTVEGNVFTNVSRVGVYFDSVIGKQLMVFRNNFSLNIDSKHTYSTGYYAIGIDQCNNPTGVTFIIKKWNYTPLGTVYGNNFFNTSTVKGDLAPICFPYTMYTIGLNSSDSKFAIPVGNYYFNATGTHSNNITLDTPYQIYCNPALAPFTVQDDSPLWEPYFEAPSLIFPQVFFHFYSNYNLQGQLWDLLKLYMNGNRITSQSPVNVPELINVVVMDYGNNSVYSHQYDLAVTGIYIDIGLDLTQLLIVNNYSIAINYHIKIGHSNVVIPVGPRADFPLSLITGTFAWFITDNANANLTQEIGGGPVSGSITVAGPTSITLWGNTTVTVSQNPYTPSQTDWILSLVAVGLAIGIPAALVMIRPRINRSARPRRGKYSINVES
jgi:hypothetical protein